MAWRSLGSKKFSQPSALDRVADSGSPLNLSDNEDDYLMVMPPGQRLSASEDEASDDDERLPRLPPSRGRRVCDFGEGEGDEGGVREASSSPSPPGSPDVVMVNPMETIRQLEEEQKENNEPRKPTRMPSRTPEPIPQATVKPLFIPLNPEIDPLGKIARLEQVKQDVVRPPSRNSVSHNSDDSSHHTVTGFEIKHRRAKTPVSAGRRTGRKLPTPPVSVPTPNNKFIPISHGSASPARRTLPNTSGRRSASPSVRNAHTPAGIQNRGRSVSPSRRNKYPSETRRGGYNSSDNEYKRGGYSSSDNEPNNNRPSRASPVKNFTAEAPVRRAPAEVPIRRASADPVPRKTPKTPPSLRRGSASPAVGRPNTSTPIRFSSYPSSVPTSSPIFKAVGQSPVIRTPVRAFAPNYVDLRSEGSDNEPEESPEPSKPTLTLQALNDKLQSKHRTFTESSEENSEITNINRTPVSPSVEIPQRLLRENTGSPRKNWILKARPPQLATQDNEDAPPMVTRQLSSTSDDYQPPVVLVKPSTIPHTVSVSSVSSSYQPSISSDTQSFASGYPMSPSDNTSGFFKSSDAPSVTSIRSTSSGFTSPYGRPSSIASQRKMSGSISPTVEVFPPTSGSGDYAEASDDDDTFETPTSPVFSASDFSQHTLPPGPSRYYIAGIVCLKDGPRVWVSNYNHGCNYLPIRLMPVLLIVVPSCIDNLMNQFQRIMLCHFSCHFCHACVYYHVVHCKMKHYNL